MLKSYEAIYEHGQLHWLGQAPAVDSARVVVVVDEAATTGSLDEVDQLLTATSGVWGNRSAQAVKQMIEQQREHDWED